MRKEPQFDVQRVTAMSMRYPSYPYKYMIIKKESRMFKEKIKQDLECYCKT